MTAILHQFPAAAGLPSLSPFCVKVHMGLRLCGIDYRVHETWFSGRVHRDKKLPVVELDGRFLVDSTAILDDLCGDRLWPREAGQRAEAHLLEDWADESLYWFGVYCKFIEPSGWDATRESMRATMPVWMASIAPAVARRHSRANLLAQGLLRRGDARVQSELCGHLDALEQRIAGREYLVGESISIADVAVTSMLLQLVSGLAPWASARIEERSGLRAYLRRIEAETLARDLTSGP